MTMVRLRLFCAIAGLGNCDAASAPPPAMVTPARNSRLRILRSATTTSHYTVDRIVPTEYSTSPCRGSEFPPRGQNCGDHRLFAQVIQSVHVNIRSFSNCDR